MNNSYIYNKWAVIGLWVLLLVGTIENAINVASILLIGSTLGLAESLVRAIAMVLLTISIIPIAKKEFLIILFTLLSFGLTWYWSATISPTNIPFLLENIQTFFIEGLPYFWFFAYFIDSGQNKTFFYLLYKICRIKLIIALTTQFVMFVFPQTDIFHDYMNSANALLLGLLIVVVNNIHNHHTNKKDTILEVLTVLSIVVLGSRGGIMCYGALYFLYFFFMTSKKKKVQLVFIGSLGLLLLYILLPLFLSVFDESNNRYLALASSNALIHDENRELIWNILWEEFKHSPWGVGVMGDRPILTTSDQIWETFYAHNLFLELIVDFGYIGFVLSGLLVFILIRTLHRCNGYDGMILCVLVSCSFVKLMVSTSLWLDPIFWAMLGTLLRLNNKRYYHSINRKQSYSTLS